MKFQYKKYSQTVNVIMSGELIRPLCIISFTQPLRCVKEIIIGILTECTLKESIGRKRRKKWRD
jgi:hypothetical protein